MFQKQPGKKDEVQPVAKPEVTSRKIAPTVISSDVRVLGNVISDGVLDINGRIEGNVKGESVYVRAEAIITGDIMVGTEVHIFGAVHGVIRAPRVQIYESGHIEGAIIHRSLTIEDGAYIDAQFKPFDAQPRLSGMDESVAMAAGVVPAQGALSNDSNAPSEEDYDLLKDLKLIN